MESRPALKYLKLGLWAVAMAGLVAAVGRFVTGLGAATNMTDGLPWGLWKVFNMVGGAALATSGFVVAAIIYALKIEKYRPVTRLAVLIGFLGYGASLFALMFDIGLPHRGWHPFVMWNPHSFLFEVFWCVSVYWMVTAYEMTPVILERFPFPKLVHFLHEAALPIVFLGITLSTMHHSSLGSLFMVSPTRLHPLWFSRVIPVQFFTSAMGSGLAVIVLISIVYGWLYKQKLNMAILTGLAKASAAMLIIYFIIRAGDLTLAGNGRWNYVFGPDATWESALFIVEVGLQVFIPVIVFLTPALRNSVAGLLAGSVSAFLGLCFHRIDVGIVGYFRDAGEVYWPTLPELALSFGVLSAAGLLFLFIIERFHIMDAPDECADDPHGEHHVAADQITISEVEEIMLGPHVLRIGLVIAVTIPAAFLAFAAVKQGVLPFEPLKQPVLAALGANVDRSELTIDGNRMGYAVNFMHEYHQGPETLRPMAERACEALDQPDELCVEKKLCGFCHHLDMPDDHATACWNCHQDMNVPTSIFDHHGHQDLYGGKKSCAHCHDLSKPKGAGNATSCIDCHEEGAESPMPGMADYRRTGFSYMAPGYKDAMHGVCLTCHRRQGADDMKNPEGLGNCGLCHPRGKTQTAMK